MIWSQSLDEHRHHVALVMEALREAHLFCSDKKTHLFLSELEFLGHRISHRGVEADPKKVEKILNWPCPRSASALRSFLGLVRYIASFLPALAEHTAILTPLTTKDCELSFPPWTSAHQLAFDDIKRLVVSRACLTVIDHDALGDNRIFVSCDASDLRTGAMLSFGPSLESSRPVAFESCQLKGAELNYPVHEKELLSIVRALKKWRVELLGVPFTVFTDHRTLENFHRQKDLSRRQARWQEYLAQFDFSIQYIKGEDNIVADALSRTACDTPAPLVEQTKMFSCAVTALSSPGVCAPAPYHLRLAADPSWLDKIRSGYNVDKYCAKLREQVGSLEISESDGLLFVAGRLVIPRVPELREGLFRCAHDVLGHFGFEKSYAVLRHEYYWPNMRKELEEMYIPGCESCQRNKGSTRRPPGPLHPLPVPVGRGDSIAIDFVGKLPDDDGFDCIATVTDRLGADIRLIPTRTDVTAEAFAVQFFDAWYCENGLPLDIVSDRDKLFTSAFWRTLHRLSGVKLKMSTSFHPQTDGSSERTNKTITQALRYHVARNQTGWVCALPRVRFALMNAENASTGFSRFQLHIGRSPRLIPPIVEQHSLDSTPESSHASNVLNQIDVDVLEARDNLFNAKVAQTHAANLHRGPDPVYAVGDKVMMSTMHRRRDYMQRGDNRVAKFMVRWDGPYTILHSHPEFSVYTLDLPAHMHIFPTFHTSLLKPFHANDDALFPSRAHPRPGPVVTENGVEEWEVERILDRRPQGRGFQYLVRWRGYGPDADSWLAGREVEDLEALDQFLEDHPLPVGRV